MKLIKQQLYNKEKGGLVGVRVNTQKARRSEPTPQRTPASSQGSSKIGYLMYFKKALDFHLPVARMVASEAPSRARSVALPTLRLWVL